MNKRRIIFNTNWLVLLFILILPYTANAAGYLVQKEEALCLQIQDKIINKQEIRNVVKASIQMGYGACVVIKCAIKGGGDLKQIIEGAVEAGTTKDVVSRCALDAGADAKDVAFILNNLDVPGLCYILPEEPKFIPPVHDVIRRGPLLSPSGF